MTCRANEGKEEGEALMYIPHERRFGISGIMTLWKQFVNQASYTILLIQLVCFDDEQNAKNVQHEGFAAGHPRNY